MVGTDDQEREPVKSSPGGTIACSGWWRLPLLLTVVLAAILLLRGRGIRKEIPVPAGGTAAEESTRDFPAQNQADRSENEPTGMTVSLGIDFGDGSIREFDAIAWQEGLTVAEVLAAAGRADKRLKVVHHGSGAEAFLTELGGLANEGAGGRNWAYAVNGKPADRSFAVYPLRPGDRILWSFTALR